MFCPKCGKELPDDSQFCLKCGEAIKPSTTASVPLQSAKPPRRGVWILLALFGLVAIWWAINSQRLRSRNGSSGGSAFSQIIPLPRTEQITNGAITVKAEGYAYYTFTVPSGATNVSVDGHFSAAGGTGNDIEVFILGQDSFVNFQNGHAATTYYNSGKVTQESINAVLPGGGTYYLVFNNNFSLLTPKAVQANATLHYANY